MAPSKVATDRLIGDVEAAPRQSIEFRPCAFPSECAAKRVVVGKIRRRSEGSRTLADDRPNGGGSICEIRLLPHGKAPLVG